MVKFYDYQNLFDETIEKRISDRLALLNGVPFNCVSVAEGNYAENISYLKNIICKMEIIIKSNEMKIRTLECLEACECQLN